ncbi:hypothetical protein I6F15_07385 [Bradyrhizobium sp. BRP14]|nr:hypothetical protein [Bradyrhizobium sp. BRP14]
MHGYIDEVLALVEARLGPVLKELGLHTRAEGRSDEFLIRFEANERMFSPIILAFPGPEVTKREQASWEELEVVELSYDPIEIGDTGWIYWAEQGEGSYRPKGSMEETFARLERNLRDYAIITLGNDTPLITNSREFACAWEALGYFVANYAADQVQIERDIRGESYVFNDSVGREIRLEFPKEWSLPGKLLIDNEQRAELEQDEPDSIRSVLWEIFWDMPKSGSRR